MRLPRLIVIGLALASPTPASAADTGEAAEAPSTGLRSAPPAWTADAIWYELVIDRFRNGDARNDPRPTDLRGASPGDPARDWQLTPWTTSFYAVPSWEKAASSEFQQRAAL